MADRIAILGAGIAGLTAADWLSAAGFDLTIFEARDRPGGRIHTLHPNECRVPVELGAEFVHGDCNDVWRAVRNSPELTPENFPDNQWEFREGELIENKRYWDEIGSVMEKLAGVERDESFAAFLRKVPEVPRHKKTLAKDFVEGFHAAAPEKVSTIAVNEAEESAEETNGQKLFKLPGGYDALVQLLVQRLQRRGVMFRFSTPAERIKWKKGQVQVKATNQRDVVARSFDAAIITLPLGVLRTPAGEPGALRFEPELTKKQGLIDKLKMGNVVKLTLQFDRVFWPRNVHGFIHAPQLRFQTWWTDKNSPVLVAWSGGQKAGTLNDRAEEEIVGFALDELSLVFSIDRRELEYQLRHHFLHDWRRDPYARGAYSYIPTGMTPVDEELAEPQSDTLFFAGEAVAPSGEQGTVHGAMASGKRAALQVLKSR